MTFVIVMGFHQIIVVMNDVKRHTYIHTYIHTCIRKNKFCKIPSFTIFLTSHSQKLVLSFLIPQSINSLKIKLRSDIRANTPCGGVIFEHRFRRYSLNLYSKIPPPQWVFSLIARLENLYKLT